MTFLAGQSLLKGQKQSLYLPEKNKNSFHLLVWVEFLLKFGRLCKLFSIFFPNYDYVSKYDPLPPPPFVLTEYMDVPLCKDFLIDGRRRTQLDLGCTTGGLDRVVSVHNST